MPWRTDEGFEPITHVIENPVMVVDINHDRGRRVGVVYISSTGEQIEVAVEHLDDNNVRVSAVNFMDGKIIIL